MRSIHGNWISFSFQRMNFLAADRIVSSGGVNIQLRASGSILHHKDYEAHLPLLVAEQCDNFHFCSSVQTIAPWPFKTFFTHFNLHMKCNNISEFCFKFKRKLCLRFGCLMSKNLESFCTSKQARRRTVVL